MAATLSVVVPVYGTKRDLPACLESLRTQSLRDAEFLLVDDASPDGAGAVCWRSMPGATAAFGC